MIFSLTCEVGHTVIGNPSARLIPSETSSANQQLRRKNWTQTRTAHRQALSQSSLLAFLSDWDQEIKADRQMEGLEKDLRLEFLWRLRFYIERRYSGDDASLLRILNFMFENENSPQNRSTSLLTPFLGELIRAILTIREPTENLVEFIRQYCEVASVQDVISAEDFLKTRSYLNAGVSETATEMDEAGWLELNHRLSELEMAAITPEGSAPAQDASESEVAPRALPQPDSQPIDPELEADLDAAAEVAPSSELL